jgi:hypothetical protein
MVSVIVNYCSNERVFIDVVLRECLLFSNDIVVSYGSRLYNGAPEDVDHIKEYESKYPMVKFKCYQVDPLLDLSKQKGVRNRPVAYWHNLARWTGVQALEGKNGWVFIIDTDEIPDGQLVKEWLRGCEACLDPIKCYKVANYWYFKDPTNQATTLEDSVLLIHSKYLTEENIFGDNERDHLIPASRCMLMRETKGVNGAILFHHFSWVRPRKQLEHKLRSWGHSQDLFKNVDPGKFVDFIYRDDNVNDIVHNYTYAKVPNKFNIDLRV